ncbi:glycosyl hydrolase [Saccharibacillus alkalitolerans]|uniref:Beta-mannosidase n=1 Tax=Saccharibacillus alkalitolerans TaxID=2705290 RepID=A0ABX0FAR8_9BACL|nr:glycosyl hydrolase [Saccharibacillus alkalitolerans]NGZ77055.1 beta-mannosidase [Saccharibacillus alkalitolerans]
MNVFKRSFVLALAAVTLLVTAMPAFAAPRTPDVGKSHWAGESIDRWKESGIVQGYGNGNFGPDRQITRAEMASMINRLFGFAESSPNPFSDVPEGAWYARDLSAARQAGYYQGFPGNKAKADTSMNRQDAAVLLASVFSLSPAENGTVSFADESEISAYASRSVQAMNGLLNGYPDGSFRPKAPITRAETVTLFDRLVSRYYAEAGTVTGGAIAGNALVNRSGVVLKDARIAGNLYLTPGIGNGDAELDNVIVDGTVYVAGGGEQSIHFKNSKLRHVIVNRPGGSVRVSAEGSSTIERLSVETPSQIEVQSGAAVGTAVIGGGAVGTAITLKGTIDRLEVRAASVTRNGQPVPEGVFQTGNETPAPSVVPPVVPPVTPVPSAPANGGNPNAGGGDTGGGAGGGGTGGGGTDNVPVVQLADPEATPATRSLFAYLSEKSGKQIMFGHQHDTTVSIAGKDASGNVVSDVYRSTGDYPAVFGWDTLSLDGYEAPPGVSGDYEASRLGLSAAMKQAHELGGIVTLSTHPYNFATGGSFNDTGNTKGATSSVAVRILPGGDKNGEFNAYLDRIANFANHLKDDAGTPIPVLFRPFHEQNGGWFWWGAATTTRSEYVELYRYTVEYLRDVKGVHNFLYVFSPNGAFNGNESEYLRTYPGDPYVDILGMDQYDNKDNAGSEAFLKGLVADLNMISKLAQAKGKIVTLSEYGYSAAGMKTTGNNEKQWFTKVLNAIKADPDASKISYMLTWANFGEGNNLYVPYKNVPGKGDHELLNDFIDFYRDPYTAFAGEIQTDNKYGQQVRTAPQAPLLHIVTPNDVGTVSEAAPVIRAKAANFAPSRVVYIAGDSDAEVPMTLSPDGYYSATWIPEAALNGTSVPITVKAYGAGNEPLTQSLSVFVKIGELPLKKISFDAETDLNSIRNSGTWSGAAGDGSTIRTELGYAAPGGDGKLAIRVLEGLTAADTWQELKLKLTPEALAGIDLSQVGRVKFSAWIPETAQNENGNAAVRGIVQLPEDWDTKYGMDSSYRALSDLPIVTLDGIRYYRFDASIELNDAEKSAAASGLAFSLVGSGLAQSGELPIYVDDIGLYGTYAEPTADAARVDDFESYGSSDEALAAKYPKAGGDDIRVSLSADRKASGNYGMKLDYSLNSAGYAGVGKSLGTLDWSEYNAVSMWIASDGEEAYAETGQPLKLVVQLIIDGGYFEAYPTIVPGQNGQVVIGLKDLTEMSWGKAGALTPERLQQVQSFNLYVNGMDGASHTGTLYFDDIRAVYDPSLPDMSNETGGPPEPHAPGVLHAFASTEDISGWMTANGDSAQAQAPTFDEAEQALSAAFSLANTGQNADGSFKESFELAVNPERMNVKGSDTLTADVKLSDGSAKARLFIKTGDSWAWSDSGTPEVVDSEGYTRLMLHLPTAAASAGVDLANVKTIGIKIEDMNGTGTSRLLLRTIELHAAEPSA